MKYTANGTAVCKFSIATNYKKKNGDQWVDEVNYFDIVLWGRQGEALQQYLVKGKLVGITGELRQDRWQDRESGQNRSKIEVIASNIQLLGGAGNSESPGSAGKTSGQGKGGYSYSGQQTPQGKGESKAPDDGFADDIPF
jgi:single-strand DNA-binding protein